MLILQETFVSFIFQSFPLHCLEELWDSKKTEWNVSLKTSNYLCLIWWLDRCRSMVLTSLAPPLFTGQLKEVIQVRQSVLCYCLKYRLRKLPRYCVATTGFPTKWCPSNDVTAEMRQYPDLGSASDWLKQISVTAQPIRSTTLIWVVTHLQYGISAGIPQASSVVAWQNIRCFLWLL